jgi:DNA polymerase III delta subunit
MDYKDFFKAIQNDAVSGAYLLHGEEEYVKESALSKLIATVDASVRDMNVDNLFAASAREVVAACETLPFLASRRVVIVRALPKENDADELKAYIDRVPAQTVLVFFIRGDADKRLAFVKAIEAAKRAVLFAPLSEYDASRWVRQRAGACGVTISDQDAEFFVSLAGTDCSKLNNEFQKAAAYAGDGNAVTKDIISRVVTRDLEFVVFSVLDDVLSGRTKDGFTALRGLVRDGEQPMEIAARIGEKARLILQARRLIERKKTKDAVVAGLGVSSGYAYRVYEAARLMSPARTEPLDRCAKALCDAATLQLTGRAKALDALEQALLILAC